MHIKKLAKPRKLSFSDEQIRAKAYEIWQERMTPRGSPDDDWQKAIRRLQQERARRWQKPILKLFSCLNKPLIWLEKQVIEPIAEWFDRAEIFKIIEKLSPILEAVGVLLIPVAVWWFSQSYQVQKDKQEKATRQQEAIKTYLNQLTTIFLDGDIQKNPNLQKVTRASTLALLQDPNMNGDGKGQVITFLSEIGLINAEKTETQKLAKNPATPIISLSTADLSGANLEDANLRGVILSGANLSNVNLSNVNLRFVDLSFVDLSNVNLRGANLIGADLSNANLSGASLQGADLSDAQLRGVNLSDAQLNSVNLRGANLSGADLGGALLIGALLGGGSLSGASLGGADLGGAGLSGADLGGALLIGANLSFASLEGASLGGALLEGANLSGAHLGGASLNGASLNGANLRFVDLSGANLSGANLRFADLRFADLYGANLSRALLSGADLSGSDLRFADLNGVDLSGAHLNRALLSGASNFSSKQIQSAKNWKSALYDDMRLDNPKISKQLGLDAKP